MIITERKTLKKLIELVIASEGMKKVDYKNGAPFVLYAQDGDFSKNGKKYSGKAIAVSLEGGRAYVGIVYFKNSVLCEDDSANFKVKADTYDNVRAKIAFLIARYQAI